MGLITNAYLVMSEPNFTGHAGSGNYGTGALNNPGAIEVLEFEFGVEQEGSEQGGRPRSVEAVKRDDLTIKKQADSRSPKLFRYCCDGTYIGVAELQVFGPVKEIPYLVYRMTYVHVAGYKVSGGNELPTEEIKLRFGGMSVMFDNAGIGATIHGGGKTGHISEKWNWVMEIPANMTDPVTAAKQAVSGMNSKWK